VSRQRGEQEAGQLRAEGGVEALPGRREGRLEHDVREPSQEDQL
jgi:hypothetical protein